MHARYDIPAERGLKGDDGKPVLETRRDYNDRFDTASPLIYLPPAGEHIWTWYMRLSGTLRRVRDGVCEPIPPTEFRAWCEASGTIVYPWEYAILCAMDVAYCSEMSKEIAAYHERLRDQAAIDAKR